MRVIIVRIKDRSLWVYCVAVCICQLSCCFFPCICVCVFVCDVDGDRDSRVEAVDKISALYFWQSHLAVDEEKRGGEDSEERVIVMELSEVRECWMKWGPEEQWETKVERKRGGWLLHDLAVEETDGWGRRMCFFLTMSSPKSLSTYLCFNLQSYTEFDKVFLCHIFACIEASNCQRPPVTSAIFFSPHLFLIWRKKYLFSFIKALYPWERKKLQCLRYPVCVCVRGMWSSAVGYYEETPMRQEIPLIGNKTPSYLFK